MKIGWFLNDFGENWGIFACLSKKTVRKKAMPPNDLQRIIESWDDLPQHIKNAIKTLLNASSSMA